MKYPEVLLEFNFLNEFHDFKKPKAQVMIICKDNKPEKASFMFLSSVETAHHVTLNKIHSKAQKGEQTTAGCFNKLTHIAQVCLELKSSQFNRREGKRSVDDYFKGSTIITISKTMCT